MKEKVRKVSFLRRTFLLSWEKGLSDSHMGNYFLNVGGGQKLGIGNDGVRGCYVVKRRN